MHMDETLRIFEASGGKEARDAAQALLARLRREVACRLHARVHAALQSAGQAEDGLAIQRRAIMRPDTMRHFSVGEIQTMNALPHLASVVPHAGHGGKRRSDHARSARKRFSLRSPQGLADSRSSKAPAMACIATSPTAEGQALRSFLAR